MEQQIRDTFPLSEGPGAFDIASTPLTPVARTPQLAWSGVDGPLRFTPAPHKRMKTRAASRRVLIIEDDPASLELYDFLLRSFGYTTNLATNGEEGLAKARFGVPDLILCDIRLPLLGGVEVMKRIKADPFLRSIPIIALTIFSSPGHRERFMAAGFDGYMAKPTIPQDFIRQIQKFLN